MIMPKKSIETAAVAKSGKLNAQELKTSFVEITAGQIVSFAAPVTVGSNGSSGHRSKRSQAWLQL